MEKCSIVIPIYKKMPLENEIKSLFQVLDVLNKYQFIFVCPDNLDVSFYENLCTSKNVEFKFKKFAPKYFKGLSGYNKLLSRVDFYKTFSDYEYILIYQLDAWVFSDNLEYWCNQNFDYIGAPWFADFDKAGEDSKLLPYAGNGGFSLRRVAGIIAVLNSAKSFKAFYTYDRDWNSIWKTFKRRTLISNILNFINLLWKRFGLSNLLYFRFAKLDLYEDLIFVSFLTKFNPSFKVAPPEIAMYFSFETLPAKLYDMTNKTLPFGCHAWEKYDYEFWKPFI